MPDSPTITITSPPAARSNITVAGASTDLPPNTVLAAYSVTLDGAVRLGSTTCGADGGWSLTIDAVEWLQVVAFATGTTSPERVDAPFAVGPDVLATVGCPGTDVEVASIPDIGDQQQLLSGVVRVADDIEVDLVAYTGSGDSMTAWQTVVTPGSAGAFSADLAAASGDVERFAVAVVRRDSGIPASAGLPDPGGDVFAVVEVPARPVDEGLVHVEYTTQLTQAHRMATPVSANASVVATVQSADDSLEVVTVTSSGRVLWLSSAPGAGDSVWATTDLGTLPGGAPTELALTAEAGALWAYAITGSVDDGLDVSTTRLTPGRAASWSSVRLPTGSKLETKNSRPSLPMFSTGIYPDGERVVFLRVMVHDPVDLGFCRCAGGRVSDPSITVSLDTGAPYSWAVGGHDGNGGVFWSGPGAGTGSSIAPGVAFVTEQGGTVTKGMSDRAARALSVAPTADGSSLISLLSGTSRSTVWAGRPNAIRMVDGADGIDSVSSMVSGDVEFVVAVTTERELRAFDLGTNDWSTNSFPIASAAQGAHVFSSRGDADLIVGDGRGQILHGRRDVATTEWQLREIDASSSTHVETYDAYDVVAHLHQNGAPIRTSTAVQVSAPSNVPLEINGVPEFLVPGRGVRCSTDPLGQIHLRIPAAKIGVPDIELNPAVDQGATVVVEPSSGLRRQLDAISVDDLSAARLAGSDEFVIDATHREDRATMSGLADFVGASLRFGETIEGGASTSGSLSGSSARAESPAALAHTVSVDAAGSRFTSGPALTLTDLATLGFTGIDWGGLWRKIDDFFTNDVGEAFELSIQTVASTGRDVYDQVVATVSLTIDGVVEIYHVTLDSIEQVLDVVEAGFRAVGVTFGRIVRWLGFIFEWGDIKRTQTAIIGVTDSIMGFAQAIVTDLERDLDSLFDDVVDRVHATFAQLRSEPFADQSVDDARASAPLPPGTTALGAHGWVNDVLDRRAEIVVGAPSPDRSDSSAPADASEPASLETHDIKLADVVDRIDEFVAAHHFDLDTAAFSKASGYFEDAIAGRQTADNLIRGLITVVEAIAVAAIDVVGELLSALLRLVALLLDVAAQVLRLPIRIPVLSDLYRAEFGRDMSMLDLTALLIAIPATVTYKAVTRTAPFATDADVAAFTQSMSKQSLLARGGFTTSDADVRPDADSELASEFATDASKGPAEGPFVMAICGALATGIGSHMSAFLDASPPKEPGQGTGSVDGVEQLKGEKPLSAAVLALSGFSWVMAIPWADPGHDKGFGWDPKERWVNVVWLIGAAPLLIDLAMFTRVQKRLRLAGDRGAMAASVLGAVWLTLDATATRGQTHEERAANVVGGIPAIFSWCRLKRVVEASKGTSLAALAFLDVGCGWTACGLKLSVAAKGLKELSSPP